MSKIHVFDIDGVVTSNEALINALISDYKGFTRDMLTDYHMGRSLHQAGLITEVNDFSFHDFFTKHFEPIFINDVLREGFTDYLDYLHANGKEVHFISARDPELMDITIEYFNRYKLPIDSIHTVGSYDKLDALREVRAEVFYEDRVETLVQALEAGVVKQGILLDMPYNRHIEHDKMIRIHKFQSLMDKVR